MFPLYRGDVHSGIILPLARAPPIRKGVFNLKFELYESQGMRSKERFMIIAHYETSY